MGRGVTATKRAFLQARDAHVQKLEAQQAILINRINDLQNEVCGLAKGNKSDDVSISETSKVVTRCQLLDWCSNEDIIVGEGEFCSAERTYKIGRIPLKNAAVVIVNFVSKEDAPVWRPTATIFSLGNAMGTKIPWPSNKIIVDNAVNSPTENHTAGSSAPPDRILIFDWNVEDLIVAEGHLISSDPKELLANNIPLGPNAALVKVDKIFHKDAYLWRPTSEMILMGDALHELIPWPIQRIGYSNPSTLSPKESSPASASCSMAKTTKSNDQRKRLLLDCNGSGEIVAEGRICSTNPEDKVHFVPLGPDASKVWVQVLKIGSAKVWRPNSEVHFVGDALGTTVAWPNDRLRFM